MWLIHIYQWRDAPDYPRFHHLDWSASGTNRNVREDLHKTKSDNITIDQTMAYSGNFLCKSSRILDVVVGILVRHSRHLKKEKRQISFITSPISNPRKRRSQSEALRTYLNKCCTCKSKHIFLLLQPCRTSAKSQNTVICKHRKEG